MIKKNIPGGQILESGSNKVKKTIIASVDNEEVKEIKDVLEIDLSNDNIDLDLDKQDEEELDV